MFMALCADESKESADTGSAMHAAAATWHENGHDVHMALDAMLQRHGEFPRANFEEATAMFGGYVRDPRNQKAKVIACEVEIEFDIPPHSSDKTGKMIRIQGKADQIREEYGKWKLHDIKTGKFDGAQMQFDATFQIAAYCHGLSLKYNRKVEPGSLIRPRVYLEKKNERNVSPDGVFFEFAWDNRCIPAIMYGVRLTVAHLRNGDYFPLPGLYCKWCSMGKPETCMPALVDLNIKTAKGF